MYSAKIRGNGGKIQSNVSTDSVMVSVSFAMSATSGNHEKLGNTSPVSQN